jgi:gliding motility-associated-like protein
VGEYPITVSDAADANYTINTIAGTLTVLAPEQDIFIPNTFTPNNDGINDTWDIKFLNSYLNCAVNIYNRYGENVYSSIGYGKPWDGTYRGAQLPVGTYYYIINLKNGLKVLSGFVAIIR